MSGNFVIADRKNYAAAAELNDAYPQITELIVSTVPAVAVISLICYGLSQYRLNNELQK